MGSDQGLAQTQENEEEGDNEWDMGKEESRGLASVMLQNKSSETKGKIKDNHSFLQFIQDTFK